MRFVGSGITNANPLKPSSGTDEFRSGPVYAEPPPIDLCSKAIDAAAASQRNTQA
jgi:hypothetical protein